MFFWNTLPDLENGLEMNERAAMRNAFAKGGWVTIIPAGDNIVFRGGCKGFFMLLKNDILGYAH